MRLTVSDHSVFGEGVLQGLLRGVEAQASNKQLSLVRHDVSEKKTIKLIEAYSFVKKNAILSKWEKRNRTITSSRPYSRSNNRPCAASLSFLTTPFPAKNRARFLNANVA